MKTKKNTLLISIAFVTLLASGATFAVSPSTGQLVIVNNLGNGAGLTQSSIKVEVYDTADSTQPCTTVANLSYNGITVVRWAAVGEHSATFCTGTGPGTAAIYQVKITPLPNIIGQTDQVVYDASINTPQATASSITFTPPTAIYGNLALVITGNGKPKTTNGQIADSTHWGFTANPTTPTFDTGNGAILTTGIPGVVGAYGLKAEELVRSYGIIS